MPPIRTTRNAKPPPAGFDDIEDTLLEFSNKMKDAENAPHDGKKRHEILWPIFQISHQRMSFLNHSTRRKKGAELIDSSRIPLHLRTLLRERSNLKTVI
jgi:hypothetical protein